MVQGKVSPGVRWHSALWPQSLDPFHCLTLQCKWTLLVFEHWFGKYLQKGIFKNIFNRTFPLIPKYRNYQVFLLCQKFSLSPGFSFQFSIVLDEEEVISGLAVRSIWDDPWLSHNPVLFTQKFLLTLHAMLSFYYLKYFLFLVRNILTFYAEIQFSWRYFANALHGDFWLFWFSRMILICSYYFCFIWHLHLGKSQGRMWQIHQLKMGNTDFRAVHISFKVPFPFGYFSLTSFHGIVSAVTSLKCTITIFIHQKLTGISLILPIIYLTMFTHHPRQQTCMGHGGMSVD